MMTTKRNLTQYFEQNPDDLTKEQFEKILEDLMHSKERKTMYDETFDCFQWLRNAPGRQELFCNYIEQNYSQFFGKKVLEVGCGANAKLSRLLSKNFVITAMDPAINTTSRKIKLIKEKFDFQSTAVDEYDLIIGLEPCDASEHIIRSCLQHKKEFIVVLCGTPHKKINGTMPNNIMAWYNYLVSIDKEHLQLEKINCADGFNPYIIKNKK